MPRTADRLEGFALNNSLDLSTQVGVERWVYTNKAGLVVERRKEDLTWAKIQVRHTATRGTNLELGSVYAMV
jgi:hypothetical protein